MKFLESDLEKIIMETDNETLWEKGLEIEGKKKSQVNIGNYGRADIITFSSSGDYKIVNGLSVRERHCHKKVSVYELKKDRISLSSFAQAVEYLTGVKDYFKKTGRNPLDYYWEINIVGKSIDLDSVMCFLPNLFFRPTKAGCVVRLYTYDIDINGLRFDEISGYYLSKKGF